MLAPDMFHRCLHLLMGSFTYLNALSRCTNGHTNGLIQVSPMSWIFRNGHQNLKMILTSPVKGIQKMRKRLKRTTTKDFTRDSERSHRDPWQRNRISERLRRKNSGTYPGNFHDISRKSLKQFWKNSKIIPIRKYDVFVVVHRSDNLHLGRWTVYLATFSGNFGGRF